MSLTFTKPSPAPFGLHHAICTEVSEPEVITTNFGDKPVIRVCWKLAAQRADGNPYKVSRTFTASLHPKANLVRFLDVWLGKTPNRIKKIDLIGRRAYLVVVHEKGKDGNTYAKVEKAMLADGDNTLTL